jgi:hypothetical protein
MVMIPIDQPNSQGKDKDKKDKEQRLKQRGTSSNVREEIF